MDNTINNDKKHSFKFNDFKSSLMIEIIAGDKNVPHIDGVTFKGMMSNSYKYHWQACQGAFEFFKNHNRKGINKLIIKPYKITDKPLDFDDRDKVQEYCSKVAKSGHIALYHIPGFMYGMLFLPTVMTEKQFVSFLYEREILLELNLHVRIYEQETMVYDNIVYEKEIRNENGIDKEYNCLVGYDNLPFDVMDFYEEKNGLFYFKGFEKENPKIKTK